MKPAADAKKHPMEEYQEFFYNINSPNVVADVNKLSMIVPRTSNPLTSKLSVDNKSNDPPLRVARYLTGSGQVHGGLTIHLMNTDRSHPIHVYYVDIIPSFLRVYFHTMKVAVNGTIVTEKDIFESMTIIPGEDRGSPRYYV